MKSRLQIIGAGIVRSGFALLGAGLIAWHIWANAGWQMPGFVTNWLAASADDPSPKRDEVRKYVLFTNVQHGSATVTTGVQYASDRDRQITNQWCYIADTQDNGRTIQLTLATKAATGEPVIPLHILTPLSDFDLTRTSARRLVKSHCRFQ